MAYSSERVLPETLRWPQRYVIVQVSLYTMADGILYYTGDGDSVGSCTL